MLRSRLVRLPDGRRFEVFSAGSGASTLVIHPGGPGFSGEYLSNLLRLAGPRRRVLLVHPRGVGRSYRPAAARAYTLPALAADLEGIRRTLAPRPIDLLGFSAGGFAAIEYALRYPARVRSLLLCGTAASAGDLRAANRTLLASATPAQRRELRRLDRRRAYSSPAYQRLIEEIERPFQSRFLRRPSKDLTASRPHPRVYRAMMTRTGNEFVVDGTLARWDARPRLSRLRCPTLVLVGRHDFLRPASRAMAERIPHARYVEIPRASHLANLERPRPFLAAIDRFLASVDRSAPAAEARPRRRGSGGRRSRRGRRRSGGRGGPRRRSSGST